MELPAGSREPAWLQTLAWARDPVGVLERGRARFGPIWTSRLVGFAPLVHVSDPDAVREVFTAGLDVVAAGASNRVLEPLLGPRSLFVLDGKAHARARKLLLPPFAASQLGAHVETISAITERAVASLPRERPFAALPAMQSIALEVILRAVFGIDDEEERRAMGHELGALLAGMSHPILLLPAAQVRLGPLTPWSRLLDLRASVHARLDRWIEARQASPDRGGLLATLLQARDESGACLPREEIRDELLTLAVAGHDTVATALAWAVHFVLHTPGVADTARAELEAGNAAYLRAVCEESLRLAPVLPFVARLVREELRIGGVVVPPGARVAPCAYLAHRERSVWGADAERFRPERFLDARPSPYAYFPFGGGSRRCIGMGFSLLEMETVLSVVLRSLDLTASSAPCRPVRRGVVLVPSGGVPIVARSRRAARALVRTGACRSTATPAGTGSSESTVGRASRSRNCCPYAEKLSTYRRCPSA